jgi:hypothetical protein
MPVHYELVGDPKGYRKKVYGAVEDIAVSPELLETHHTAWDIRRAYDLLWDQFKESIIDYFFSTGSWLRLKDQLKEDGWTIVSSLPAPVLCLKPGNHDFLSTPIWAMGDAPPLGRMAEVPVKLEDGTIRCSGRPEDPWYRISRVFGHSTVEWPENITAPPGGASLVRKPTYTNCDCNRNVIRVGRFGAWEKGLLSHSAFHVGISTAFRQVAA